MGKGVKKSNENKGKEPNIIHLTQEQLDNAKQDSINKTYQQFLKNTKNTKKGIGDMLTSPSPYLQGFHEDRETQYLNTDEFSEYLFPKNGGTSPFPFGSDYTTSRARNQSNWEQAGHVAAKIIPNTILEFTGMLGNVLDLEDYDNTDNEIGNWLNTWAQEKKAEINEALPIYRENPTKALDVGDFAWWMENGSALVESAAAFVGLGYLTGGAALRMLSTGGRALEFLHAIGRGVRATDTVKKGTQFAAGLTNTLMLNQAEGIGVAVQTYERAYNEALQELKANNINTSEEELELQARAEASRRASSALNFNRANILLNLTSSFAFLRNPALSRQLVKNPSIRKSVKTATLEGFQESGEELINLISEEQALDDTYSFEKAFNTIASREGAEAALLGFVGGFGQTAMTNAGRELKLHTDKNGKRISRNTEQRQRFYEQQQTIERWEGLSKSEKFSDVSDVYMKSKESLQLYKELQNAQQKGDTNKVTEIKNTLLRNQAYDAFSTGTTEQLISVFKGIAELTPENAELKGLDKATYVEDSNNAINLINSLEKEYNKSQSYMDSYSVYENRANNLFLKNIKNTNNDTLVQSKAEVFNDVIDLGIKESDINVTEEGRIKFNNYNRYGQKKKNAIKNLKSLIQYENILNRIKNIDKDIEANTLEYSRLTSKAYQAEVKQKINEVQEEIKEQQRKQKTEEQQRKKENAKQSQKKKFKKDLENEETQDNTTTTTTESNNEKVETVPNVFKFPNTGQPPIDNVLKQLETQENDLYNSKEISSKDKLDYFKNKLNTLESGKINAPDNVKAGMSIQYTKVIGELEQLIDTTEQEQEVVDAAKEKASQAIRDFGNSINDEAKSPIKEGSDDIANKVAQFKQIVSYLQAANVPISFPAIATFSETAMGKAKFIKIFDDLQAIYNLSKVGEISKHSYEDIFLTNVEKNDILKSEAEDLLNTYLSELYNVSDLEYATELEESVITFLEEQGYKIYQKDKRVLEGLKVIEGYNKIAHLDKLYKTTVVTNPTDKFNRLHFSISKSDLNRELNSRASNEVLDFNKVNKGTKIQLKLLDEVIHDDGTITYKDGKVEKNGEIIQKDPVEVAPIGMVINGKVIEGAYLHVPDWINEFNIADANEVKNQKAYLRSIRQKILDSKNKTITTTIKERSDGHLMLDPDGNLDTVTNNMPNVTLGIGKDDQIYIGKNKTITIDRKRVPNIKKGYTYAVFPVNKDKYMATPIQPKQLANLPEIVDSIVSAVSLYLTNDVNEKVTAQLFDKAGINITTISGLRKYLNKFVYLNPNLDINFNKFKTVVTNTDEKTSIIRIANENIEFGRGANIGDTIKFINRDIINTRYPSIKDAQGNEINMERKGKIKALLLSLRNVLENNMQLNVKKDLFNTIFTLPIIKEDSVEVSTMAYNDFIKQNTLTPQYSVNIGNKDIYTVQSNLEFNTDFVFKPEIGKEIEEEAFGTPTEEAEDTLNISFGDSTLTIDFDNPLDVDNEIDKSPLKLTKEQIKEYKDTIPQSLTIQGVSLPLQTTIINYLVYNIIKDVAKNNKGELSLDYIDSFKSSLKRAVEAYTERQNQIEDTEKVQSLQHAIDVLNNIINNYNKLSFIVLDKLRTFNNIKVNGKVFKELKESLDEDTDAEILDLVREDTSFWRDGGVFEKSFKTSIPIRLKNYLSSIVDVAGFTYEEGKRIAIPKKGKFLGMEIPVPFDHVIDEVSGILAFNNFENDYMVTPSFDNMIELLEKWVETKPFLHNVIKELQNADEQIKNEFVSVMSKHYTNHVYAYKTKKGNVIIKNSDNNAIIKTIQTGWYNNIIESELTLINDDKEYIVNEDMVDSIVKDANEFIKLLKSPNTKYIDIINKAKPLLDNMGFRFSKSIIGEIQTKGIQYNKTPYSLLHLFLNSDGAFNIYIKRLKAIKGLSLEQNHPFANNTALDKFTRVLAKQNPSYFTNSFRDVRGRLYYAYSPNKFITDRFKHLKHDKNLLENLKTQPFSKDSTWLQGLLTDEDFKRHFQYFTMDGYNFQNRKGKKLQHLTPAEYEELKVNMFFSQNRKGDEYIINMYYPTTADKNVQYGIKTLGKKWSEMIDPKTNAPTTKMIDELFNIIIKPEIRRILNVQVNPDKHNVKGYKEGGKMFNFIPELNSVEGLWVEGTNELVADIETNETLKTELKKVLFRYIVNLVQSKKERWKELGLTLEETKQIGVTDHIITKLKTNKNPDSNVLHDAYDYVINYLIGNVNIYQLFTTDPAFYWKSNHWKNVVDRLMKEGSHNLMDYPTSRDEVLSYYTKEDWIQEHEDLFDHMGKRLGGDSSPGNDLPDTPTNTYKLAIIADDVKESALADYYKGLLRINYPKVNATDAQEFTTLKEHLYVMNKQGKISTKVMNKLLQIDKKGKTFSAENLQIILQPMKPVYVSNIWTDGIEHRLFVKSSSFPLFKQLTKGLQIDKLRKKMENEGVDRVAFESAVKVGGLTKPSNVFTNGEINTNFNLTLVNNGNPINRQGFKIQQEVPYKETQYINDGTQQRKLLTANVRDVKGFRLSEEGESLTGQEIQDRIDKTYNALFKIKYNNLIKEIGYDVISGSISNFNKLQNILEEEGLARNYSIYDLESLKAVNGNFAVPLWLTSVSGKIEAMLNSIVDNRIRKYQPKGQSFVLGTSTGFKPVIEGKQATEIIKNTSGIVYDKEWFDRGDFELLPMRTVKGKVQPAEVFIPFKLIDSEGKKHNMSHYVKDGFINTDRLPRELLKLFGFRIPTQNLNSMSMIKIVGFLPETSGDLMLAPADWTVKMGSDFDVDKLFSLMYNVTVDKVTMKVSKYRSVDTAEKLLHVVTGKTVPFDEKELENQLLDLHFSILNNPSKKVQSELSRPLSFGELIKKDEETDLIREIYPHVAHKQIGIGISEEYQTRKYKNARAGKAGIGVFSTDSVFNALIQNKDIYLQKHTKKGLVPLTYKLGDRWSNYMSNPKTNTGKYKSSVIEAYQSLSVDNENEQGLHKLNINSYTFDAIRGLIFGGFDETLISYFINQPIIRRYVELLEKEADSSTNYTLKELNADISKEFPITDTNYYANYELYSNVGTDQMKDIIIDNNTNNKLDTNLQRYFLNRFVYVSEHGKTIKGLQSAINADSAGLGKDLFYSSEKENQILELSDKVNVANADSLIGEYFTLKHGGGLTYTPTVNNEISKLAAEWYNQPLTKDRKEEIIKRFIEYDYIPVSNINTPNSIANTIQFIKPTTISGFASVYALMFNNNLWSRYFPYNNPKVKSMLNTIATVTNKPAETIIERAELNRTIFNATKSYLSSQASHTYTTGDITMERSRLLMDIKDNKSLATIIKTLREEGKLNNAFINRLEFEINKEKLPSNIIYKANVAENIDERGVYAAFSKMFEDTTSLGIFNDIEYTPRLIAQDLITHQLSTGGIQKAKQFIRYIPINYLQTIGYYNYIDKLNFSNEEDINYNNIENQLLQHNPREVSLSEADIALINGTTYKYYDSATIIRQLDTNTENVFPLVFSIPDNTTIKGYRIYFYNKEARHWEQKDTLGKDDILEYDPTKAFGKSLIVSNKVPEVTQTSINNPKEIDVILDLKNPTTQSNQILYDPTTADIIETYKLNQNETSLVKLGVILERIIDNDYNKFNSYIAQELLNNLTKIKDIRFIVDTLLNAEGSYNINDNTIKINPTVFDTHQEFEEVILEEVIHAFTKKSLNENTQGEVLRLKGLFIEAIDTVKNHLGENADAMFTKVKDKVNKGEALTNKEYNLIYPLINVDEFVGRLFKSKELQELLNNQESNIKGKSILDSIWSFVKDLLQGLGIDIKKDSVLDYAITDIISLIKQPAPSSDIKREIQKKKKVIRTKETIYAKLNLLDDEGRHKSIAPEKAQHYVDLINDNVSNLHATTYNGKVFIVNRDEPLPLFDTDEVLEDTVEYSNIELFPGIYATKEQENALTDIDKFLKSNKQFYMLRGRGGTGKTTIIKEAIKGKRPLFVAPTHKAKNILSQSVNREAITLASSLLIDMDETTGKFRPNEYKRKTQTMPIAKASLIIIDEASMINDNLLTEIKENIRPNAKVIFMGDNVQLPPVGQETDSAVFKLRDGFTLTQRMRQGEKSPIVPLTDIVANNVENITPLDKIIKERTSVFNYDTNQGVLFLNTEQEMIDAYINDYKEFPTSTKIITFNNQNNNNPQSVKNINIKVRNLLYDTSKEFNEGEQLMAYNTLLNIKGEPIIENAVDYTVVDAGEIIIKDLLVTASSRAKGTRSKTFTFEVIPLTVRNNITNEVKKFYAPTQLGKAQFRAELTKTFKTDTQMAVIANQQVPDLEFGYAITSHKSQGSTYRNAYVLEDNIIAGNLRNAKQKNQSLYVAISRASDKVVIQSVDNPISPINNVNNSPIVNKQEAKISPLLRNLNNRIFTLEKNIEKAKQRKEFDKEQALIVQLEELVDKRNRTIKLSRLRNIAAIGGEDMQEVASMFKGKVSLEDTLYIRKILHFWKSAIDNLFNEDEKSSKTLLDSFKHIEAEAARFEHKLERIETEYMEKLLKKYGSNMSVEDIFYHFKDINGLQAHVLDISRSNNDLLNSIYMSVKEANIDATDESNSLLSRLSDLERRIKPVLKTLNNKELYEVFRQRTSNNNLTGHLVNRYSHKFFKDKGKYIGMLNDLNNFTTYSNLIKWANENTEHIILEYLFPYKTLEGEDKKKATTYKQKLKEKLGEAQYKEFITKQAKNIETFNNNKKGYMTYLMTTYSLTSASEIPQHPEAYKRYLGWIKANSPYQFYNQIKKNKPIVIGEKSKYRSHMLATLIPSKDEYYDNNFKQIERNKDLLEFYNYYVNIDRKLKQYLPEKERIGLAINGLPHVDKILLEAYKDKGMKAGLLPIWDAMKETVRRNEEGIIDYSIKDPVTETEEKSLSVNLTRNNYTYINDYITTKKIAYELKHKKASTDKVLQTWKEEAINDLAQKKSYDLPKVLRMYSLMTLAYKHKAKIEDNIKLAQNILHQQKEYVRTNRGIIKEDEVGKPITKTESESFKNTKKQFDYFTQVYYGQTKEDEGVTTQKVYTSEDKKKLAELNDLLLKLEVANKANTINATEYVTKREQLQEAIDKVGGVAVWSRRGDALLKYVQLKGMGWNVMSSIANIGFGFIANYIEASGGQLYNRTQLNKAYSMVFGSIGKNATFNKVDFGHSKKIRSLMNKWDILKDASKELFQNPLTVATIKSAEWLAPYNLIQRTEYINQAPIMIAMMLSTKIDTNKGKVSVWEAFDENGNWNEEYGEQPKEVISKLRMKIDQVNKMNHGNYDPNSPLLIKNKFWGRAISQFRSWMYENYAVRFEGEKRDEVLEITRKGRYRSLLNYFANVGALQGAYGIMKGLLREVSFGTLFKGMDFEKYKDNNFKEVDAANMRKVMTEVLLLASVYSSYLVLSTLAKGLDEEEDKAKVYALNILINQGLRLKTDILFYIDPREFKNLLRDLVPATTLIKDTIDWSDAVLKFVAGEDEITSGVYSGHSRLLRETAQMLPLGTQIYKNINYSIQAFDK